MRSAWLLVALLLALSISCTKSKTPPPASPEQLVQDVLAAMKQPADGQFEDPEDAAKFLIKQVKAQNLSEASRVFPIREIVEKDSLEAHVQRRPQYRYPELPLKNANAHNLLLAMGKLEIYGTVRLMLMDFDVSASIVLDEHDPVGHAKKLTKTLDPKKLADWEIKNAELIGKREVTKTDFVEKGLGATEQATVKVTLKSDKKQVQIWFNLLKIGSNWRIMTMPNWE